MKEQMKQYQLGHILVYYIMDSETGQVGLCILPQELADQFTLDGDWNVDSLVQVKVVGDSYPDGFSQGHTMRNSDTTRTLKLEKHQCVTTDDFIQIETTLKNEKLRVYHTLTYNSGERVVYVVTKAENITKAEIALEMLSSYSIGGFSPLDDEIRAQDFILHRLRSKWSAEGQLVSEGFLELQLEPAWQLGSVQSIRFGEVGSMPVRGYFPWMVIQDKKYDYCLGAQIFHNASWQMEVYCRDARYACSGGLADREFGHWIKKLKPQEVFEAPMAVLSVNVGSVEELSNNLTDAQKSSRAIRSSIEKSMPIIFNEFCTTWGFPSYSKMKQIVNAIAGKGFGYCVIDAGWYSNENGNWYTNMGDWIINEQLFPGGFGETVQAIKQAGMIPGLWFELEVVGCEASINERSDFLLCRDGHPIQSGLRRFFDLRKPEVIQYLSEKVIGLLKQYGFGYLKIDYNDTIGIGCDGSDSLGEGLREATLGTKEFIKRIREEIPDIVIENCSSGGHRLEPSMMAITDMSSFSDAHECVSSPIIAANVLRAIRPEQSQIWAVLRVKDDDQRLYYTMSNTFLGRMCISGDVIELTDHQWNIVKEGMDFYKHIAHIIKDGTSHSINHTNHSYRQPEGWQAVIRTLKTQVLVVVHTFYQSAQSELKIQLQPGTYAVKHTYKRDEIGCTIVGSELIITGLESLDSAVVELAVTDEL